jgi:hypothetical protein
MRLVIIALFALAVAAATDASGQGEQPVNRSADWFLAHPEEIPAAREWCGDHPTERDAVIRRGDLSCIYADQAYARIQERQAQEQLRQLQHK